MKKHLNGNYFAAHKCKSGNREIMSRIPYTTDGEFTLYPLADADRENYVELHRQINGEGSFFLNPHLADMMWEGTVNSGNLIYSIFDSNNEYCGSTELQNPTSDTPEIGIDLMENKRNQGIAAKVVKMLVKKVCQEREIDTKNHLNTGHLC